MADPSVEKPEPSPTGFGSWGDLTETVKNHALEAGFDLVGVASAAEFTHDRSIAFERLDDGLMDGLPWFNEARILRGTTPESLLPGARSIICLGVNYYQDSPGQPPVRPTGKVARYAWGRDYHQVIKGRMREFVEGLRRVLGKEFAARWYVDDGPMLDRAAAARSGLGWFGKNTNILTSSQGSWIFLGQVVTDLDLTPDQPLKKTCGDCVRCIDACPTGAIIAPYVLDNTRCISYLTIENRGEIPLELRPLMRDWVFGCDICQDVCPVNRNPSLPSGGQVSSPKVEALDLIGLLELTEEEFRRRFRNSPIYRAKRVGLQRNACVALGNLKETSAVPALAKTLGQGEALVRGHAAWALGNIGTNKAVEALRRAEYGEEDSWVRGEIASALLSG